jgi:DNA polymerase delta subunit 1
MTGLTVGSYIHIKEVGNSADYYNGGEKFAIVSIGPGAKFTITGNPTPDADKLLKWGLAKDDITYRELFELSNGSAADRAVVAKYCAQDCNLVHYLINKNDIITDYVEMSNICYVPISFLVTRGQSIKLLSLLAKFCSERKTLIPVIEKRMDGGYEGAIVLPPKCGFYADMPIAVNDFNSLYPSSMISENISHDSKVWTREYDLTGRLIRETGVKDDTGAFMYDNLEGYDYVNITYDTYKWERDPKKPSKKPTKRKCGTKVCRYAQFPDGRKAIIPAVLEVLLGARKSTRASQKKVKETDPARWQTLEVRQLNYKKCANSIYGQCGASTSPFCDKDIAASTTAIGRLNITYAKRIIEEVYNTKGSPEGVFCKSAVAHKKWGEEGIISHAEYIYGDTDSIFYTFNMTRLDGTPIKGQDALEITIELAQQVGDLASSFLKCPHNWEYEKTFMPFCLLSKKRYVGMLFETNPHKGKRKEMGIVLRRRDNAPIVKDVYGGIIDILLKKKDIMKAADFLRTQLREIADERIPMKKLVITKQLRSSYARPEQIAHKVLADRIGEREPGNRPKPGDRIDFVYIQNPRANALQGDKIENPGFVSRSSEIKIDYAHYITNQIMKPVQQVFALVLEDIWRIQGKQAKLSAFKRDLAAVANRVRAEAPPVVGHTTKEDRREWIETKTAERTEKLKNDEVYHLLFESFVRDLTNKKLGNQPITAFFQTAAAPAAARPALAPVPLKERTMNPPHGSASGSIFAVQTPATKATKIVRQKKRIVVE